MKSCTFNLTPSPLPATLPYTLHLVGGEPIRGATTVLLALVDRASRGGWDYEVVDGGSGNPQLGFYLPQFKRIDLESGIHAADAIFSEAIARPVTFLLEPKSAASLHRWLRESGVLEAASEYGLRLVRWFVSDGSPQSIENLRVSLADYSDRVMHVLVRNTYFCDYASESSYQRWQSWWPYLLEEAWVSRGLADGSLVSIEFPKLYSAEMARLQNNPMFFSEAIACGEFPILSRSRFFRFVRDYSQAFYSTGLFGKPPEASPSWGKKTEELIDEFTGLIKKTILSKRGERLQGAEEFLKLAQGSLHPGAKLQLLKKPLEDSESLLDCPDLLENSSVEGADNQEQLGSRLFCEVPF
ncbi:hypothetical protein [Laspinema olomoucense]|uniref:hypothetical protein n=1 Tax=Laspinema olomoucense TaxID=3231600 RepID=UPI0021BAB9DA|nr:MULTISPECIES: hypothetical protein [unclassified Laspinema]MCT7975828.1 hypothetical protein [Laspinema sp. D3d]MCT7996567.1 hypothetical protein [Laspinema sp. D3c]